MKKFLKFFAIFVGLLLITSCAEEENSVQIAVVLDMRFATFNPWRERDWVAELKHRHGQENVVVYSLPEFSQSIAAIAESYDIVIIRHANADYGRLREKRDDIFIILIEPQEGFGSNADLVLSVDRLGMQRAFPAQARAMGAETLVYFYDSSIWEWDENAESEEAYLRRMMREESEAAGLLFVEVDIKGAIQCGSSHAMFLSETLPLLLEEHGSDIVFFDLDNERTFWMWLGSDFIYLPMAKSWFEPNPIDIALELALVTGSAYPNENFNDIAYLIEGIRNVVNERNQSGRVASMPISTRFLFPIAAVEYAMQREYSLEQVMVNLIAEYTGVQNHGVILMANENHVMVLLDWLVY